ncbi:hypothetical protein [Vibrio sp. AND4]|uniref:hypothetical protein n=1 Tax=Vibrio sp. AND4 TaxID=314289 RepID=UPI00015F2FCD|nr:hypothetical protein [Vibrio sp. AND4]EDP60694.1 hypothetical protein AND4_07239 [Vibrio sp. AND4]
MKKVILLTTLATSLVITAPTFARGFTAGVWKESLGPLEGDKELCMGGYGMPLSKLRCNIEGEHDDLSVRALYLEKNGQQINIVSIDAPGIGDSIIDGIKTELNEISVNEQNVYISATHTHAGLDYQGIWGGVSPEYKARLISLSAKAVRQAQLNAQRVKLFASTTTAPVSNRRGLKQVDDTVTTLHIVDVDTGDNVSTLINMSAHPTILDQNNHLLSSDYVYYLREALEQELGGMSIFVNGILGDAQFKSEFRTFTSAKEFGDLVASNVVNALSNRQRIKGEITLESKMLSHEVTNPNFLGLIRAESLDVHVDGSNNINAKVTKIELGDSFTIITSPGEALTNLGLPIKKAMSSRYKMMLGLTDGSYGYLIPSEEFETIDGRKTEEQFSIDKNVGDEYKKLALELIRQ